MEEVVWRNLPELLNLKPLSRQFSIDGKFCDILAIESLDQLAIIELKNTEDRYVVQQLVRYYAAIKAAAAHPSDVDITKPIRLIAIAPSFHADTLSHSSDIENEWGLHLRRQLTCFDPRRQDLKRSLSCMLLLPLKHYS